MCDEEEEELNPMIMAGFPKTHELVEGPFYAILQECFQENEIDGMEIDGHTRALRAESRFRACMQLAVPREAVLRRHRGNVDRRRFICHGLCHVL